MELLASIISKIQFKLKNFNLLFILYYCVVVPLINMGHGDIYLITYGGKIFTSIILVLRLGVITIPAGLIASVLSKARDIEFNEKGK